MQADVLILAPKFELATEEWFPWLAEYLFNGLRDAGLDVICMQGDAVTQAQVFHTIQDYEPKLILGVGHGNASVYTGQNYNVIWRSGQYPNATIAGRNFSPVSCLVGLDLLPDMVARGLGAGLGEDIEYSFWIDQGKPPLEDPTLALFTKSEFTYAFALAEGYTHDQARQIMLKAYYAAAETAYPHIASTLINDADHRLAFGDGAWKLVEGNPPEPPAQGKIHLQGYVNVWGLKFPIQLEGILEEE